MNMPQFTAEASLGKRTRYRQVIPPASTPDNRVSPALVGSWPFGRCSVNCIEACVEFCEPTGWDCCGWITRCALVCDGQAIITVDWPISRAE